METEDDADFVRPEIDNNLVISSPSPNTEFCLVFDDDLEESTEVSKDLSTTISSTEPTTSKTESDLEAIKNRAAEIASNLQKFRTGKSTSTTENYEPPEEFKRYHETSLFVAQKLKEDRQLFEESKKRSEAVRSKRSHKDISKLPPEEHANFDEIRSLKQKIEKLESTVDYLQNALDAKDRVIHEKEESIKTLSESVSNEYAARLSLLEQSQEEIERIKSEHLKSIERVNNSKQEYCNQLQVVRQKYLRLEHEFKSLDFTRTKLVNKNTRLEEKIAFLEEELKNLNSYQENQPPVPDLNDYLPKESLQGKLQSIEMVLNEFYSYILDNAESNSELLDEDTSIEDGDVLKILEKTGDKLESMFYLVKDKFAGIADLENNLSEANARIVELQRLNNENKQQETKLKKLLATLKAKVQQESNACKDLTEELSKSKERVHQLEHELASRSSSEDEWKTKYIELEKLNEDISYQLNEMREKVEAVEFVEASSQAKETSQIDSLKCELARLHEENTEISMLLEMKTREYDVLMIECETLRKAQEDGSSSDKTENDFVVLQKKDAESAEEDWKAKYQKLCEDHDKLTQTVRTMSEKAIEWGNEKLTSQNYQQENEHLQNQYQTLLHQLDLANREIADLIEYKSRAAKEIEILNTKLDSLESQLIANEDLIRDQTSDYDLLLGKLQVAEDLNKKLQKQVEKLEESSQHHEDFNIDQLKAAVATLESEKSKLAEECDKFKNKYQRLQIYCKTNINKGDKSSDGNAEVEKFRQKCKELLLSNKQLQENIGKLQSEKDAELEKMNVENQALQEFCNEARQRIESLRQENSQLQSFKQTHDELLVANQRLREALQQAQQTNDYDDELETLKLQNQMLNERLVEVSRELEELQQGNLNQGYQMDVLREENHLQVSRIAELEQIQLDKGCELDMLREENQVQKMQIEDLSEDSSQLDVLQEQYQTQKLKIEVLSKGSCELDELREQCQEQQSRIEALSQNISELDTLREENQVQKSQIETLSRNNHDLQTRLSQTPQLENVRRELEWYRSEYQTQSEYLQEASRRLDALIKENEELKQIKSTIDQQFATLCEDSQVLRDQVDLMKKENQSLDQSNQQLKEFCDKARQQISSLNETSQSYKAEVQSLIERCSNLEATNQSLSTAASSSDDLERIKGENEMLVATNEQLMEFCSGAKLKIAELERVKRMCDELQETVDSLRKNYETELAELRDQLLNDDQQTSENEARLALETELALAAEKIAGYEEQLVLTRDELVRVKSDLRQIRSQVQTSQNQAIALISECFAQVGPISDMLAQLRRENEQLKEQCTRNDQNTSSNQAPRIFGHFRSSSPTVHEISVQCDESIENLARQMYEQDLKKEREKYEAALAQILGKINDLQGCCDKVDMEFKEKERIVLHYKTKIEEERDRYETTIDQLRRSVSETAVVANQKQEAERQQQSHMERYKEVVTEERAKYEQIIQEMQQNLQHYKSLVDEERTKYERIIHEMQENANRMKQARVSVDESHQQPNLIYYDKTADHRAADEVKLFDVFKSPAETVQESLPSVKKYYDYCKGVIKKEIKDILNPEDDVVGDWASDHVNIDDDATSADDSAATPVPSQHFIEVLDELVRRFSITTFTSDYIFNETMEEFSLAFKLAELFQVVVAYYIDSPRAVENPYALELLKKFRDVAQQVDDGQSPPPGEVLDSSIPRIPEEAVDTQLLITAKRLESENRYLLQAVSLIEHLIAEYWGFDSPWNLQTLVSELRQTITDDTGIPYYDLSTARSDPDFSEKAMNKFGEVFNEWKEMIEKHTEALSVLNEIKESDKPAAFVLVDVYKTLEIAKTKLHDLICDLHYIYSVENSPQVNPVEFFEQIEDINQYVEKSIHSIINDESIKHDVAQITASAAVTTADEHHHHHHHHSHEDLYDESQSDDATSEQQHHHHHGHHSHHEHPTPASSDTTSAELKGLLAESNRKIERLVKELTDVKSSREYNEMKQLHAKLDETLYQLHVRDVHCVELTQELTQLLSERDSLQLKLSTILRQNEQLRESQDLSSRSTGGTSAQSSNLENKLEELQRVNYMKDPRISEASRLHHASQMQLFSEDVAESSSKNKENKESGGFSLFKWITGDTEDN